jgi:hypothetical protein
MLSLLAVDITDGPLCQGCGNPREDFAGHRFDPQLALHQSAPVLLPTPAMARYVP